MTQVCLTKIINLNAFRLGVLSDRGCFLNILSKEYPYFWSIYITYVYTIGEESHKSKTYLRFCKDAETVGRS